MTEESPQTDEELAKLLNLKIDEIGDFDFIDEEEKEEVRQKMGEILGSAPENQEELEGPEPDKAGFNRILHSPLALKYDEKFQNQKETKPEGKKLLASLSQISVKDRTPGYKKDIHQQYQMAVKEVYALYHALSKAQAIDESRIRNLVRQFLQIFITDRCILLNLSNLNEPSKDYLFQHALNVCLLALNIASASEFSEQQVLEMGMAGILADVGMMQIPPGIRTKKGSLNQHDYYEVLKHPTLGMHLLDKVGGLHDQISYVSYQHHERLSGVGYPKKRKGRIIHAYSRIVAIADVYQAMVSQRSYRPPLQPNKAMNNIVKMGRMGLLGLQDVLNFVRFASIFPVGSLVKLKSGPFAKVIEPHPAYLEKPTLSVLSDPEGRPLSEDKIYQVELAYDDSEEVERPAGYEEFKHPAMLGF